MGGAERMASSTTCGGMRTIRVSRSTTQPPSLKMCERIVRLDPHPRALEHLERAEMDVVELGLREHGQAEPA